MNEVYALVSKKAQSLPSEPLRHFALEVSCMSVLLSTVPTVRTNDSNPPLRLPADAHQ
jgi:hypothetical protein